MPPRKRASDLPSELTDQEPEHMTDDELAEATTQAARDAGNVVRLRLHRAFPVDAFEHTAEDGKTYTVTADDDGVDVPAEHHEALIAAAKDAGLTVKKVSE